MSRISINANMPTIPKGIVPIYKVRTPNVDESTLFSQASRFKLKARISAGSYCQDVMSLTYSEGPFDVTLFKASGGLRFKDRTRWQVDDGKSNTDISDQLAVKIARRYIGKLKLAPSTEFDLLKVTRLHVGSTRANSDEAEERIIDVGVCFQRTINQLPVDGPGGKIVVYMDHEGKVTGLDKIWRGLGGILRKSKLRPPEKVLDDIEKRYRNGEAGTVEVYRVRFGYFELGLKDEQHYLQPAYVALLKLISADERFVMNSVYVSPAATDPIGVLTPPAPRQVRLKPRQA